MKTRYETTSATEDNFAAFFWVRVTAAVVIAVAVIWAATMAIGYLEKFQPSKESQAVAFDNPAHQTGTADLPGKQQSGELADANAVSKNQAVHSTPKTKTIQHGVAVHGDAAVAAETENQSPGQAVRGVAFVTAVIKPLEYELQERRLGWRPNDVVQYTDNVNNFQLGVLEATRRAATRLAERISRTGTTNVLDENLERAMNCFMIDPDSYLLPSAESKYEEGLEELRTYKKRLVAGDAEFYTRADNLIPLLVAFADLLGSCDDNLVKASEKDGKPVSTFAADDYFYYAKGVASAVLPILEAVAEDFQETLITRRAMDVLHHAIHACHEASEMEPLIVLEGDLDGFFANHRANMAAHISHARFYLDVLTATLST